MRDDSKLQWDEDRRLLQRAAMDDHLAFEILYKKYYPLIFSYLQNINGGCSDSAEMAHETLCRFWKTRSCFHGQCSVRTFIFAIAKNTLRETYRKPAQIALLDESHLSERHLQEDTSSSPLADHCEDLTAKVNNAMSQLSSEQAEAIRLVYLESLPHREAAQRVGCSVEALRGRLRRARHHLTQTLSHPLA